MYRRSAMNPSFSYTCRARPFPSPTSSLIFRCPRLRAQSPAHSTRAWPMPLPRWSGATQMSYKNACTSGVRNPLSPMMMYPRNSPDSPSATHRSVRLPSTYCSIFWRR